MNPARLKSLVTLQELAASEAETARNFLLTAIDWQPGYFRDHYAREAAHWQRHAEQTSANARALRRLLERLDP